MIDRGGTFTDVVTLSDDGALRFRKVRSDEAVIGELAQGALRFGTTVATNALLERTGVRTLALLTEGLEDLPWIGDMTRPALFDPFAVRPPPLCERSVGVAGRLTAEGAELEPLVLPDPSVLDGVDAVAIVLLHAGRNPEHERALARWVQQQRPDLFVAVGHSISPERGYLERLETTLVHAAITPVLAGALRRDRIPPSARAIRSDGSLCAPDELIAPDAVLSGPAGGVLAVQAVARQAGFDKAIGLDIGGTSADICRVGETLPRRTGAVQVAGVRIRRPMLAVDTIAAGGGSILWHDGTRIGVGPRSAGADPGPQCYGRGGPPTLTDAALAAGRVDPARFDPPLQVDAVDLPGEARAFLELAEEKLAAAVRQRVLSEGEDPAEHVLVAFGGAAGQYAVGVAERLGIDTVLVHPAASVLSAWGQALATEQRTTIVEGDAPEGLAGTLWARVRVRQTEGVIEVPYEGWQDHFRQAFHRRYGRHPEGELVIDSLRATTQGEALQLPPAEVRFTPVEHQDGTRWDSDTTSVWVPRGWRATREAGLLCVRRDRARRDVGSTRRTPAGVALWGSRFMHAAEQGGAVLQRLARSVNIRERLDFSVAVFDQHGTLVANAPHIPVHLGAMGVTVRDLLTTSPAAGTSWLTNDPQAGGSHLPDLTVMTVGSIGGERVVAASRAHHVDVGGITPGSMPPFARSLDEEGLVFRRVPIDRVDLTGCRQPDTVRADLDAQVAANQATLAALERYGPAIHPWMAHLLDATAELASRLALPSGQAHDSLDGVPLVLTLAPGRVDFTGTGGPHPGNLNAPPAVTRAAVLYALRVLIGTDLPLNEGLLRGLELVLPSPSILAPPHGAAVAGGNVETSMRIADLVLAAAGYSAFSAGTMNNLTLGGDDWAVYETLGGGQGGAPGRDGPSARQLHLTNTRATDPEVLERRAPVRLRRFAIRRGSGAPGEGRGGDGLIREIEVLAPCQASLLACRRAATGDEVIRQGQASDWRGDTLTLEPGDRVRVRTPGGAGWREG